VQAAGGVVNRLGGEGEFEVLLVHRPRYDDWTIPKGKLEPGETHEQAAVREVEEETGFHCELGRELPSTSYHDSKGRPKTVLPHREVDEIRWLSLRAARELLSHRHDHDVLQAFAEGDR
jgi:8-oxo-dGTP pyrophosphatase MutT (NUDIX family)